MDKEPTLLSESSEYISLRTAISCDSLVAKADQCTTLSLLSLPDSTTIRQQLQSKLLKIAYPFTITAILSVDTNEIFIHCKNIQ